MAVKIAGIITLGIVALGLFAYLWLRADQKEKQRDADRKHRLAEKTQIDNFTLELFDKILKDKTLDIERYVVENNQLRGVIAERDKKIKLLEDNASKIKIKNPEVQR